MQDEDLVMYKHGQLAAKRALRGRGAIKGEAGYPEITGKSVEAAYDSLEAGNTPHNINRAYAALDLPERLDDKLDRAYQLGLYEGLRGRLRQLLYPGKSVQARHHATKKSAAQLDREIGEVLSRVSRKSRRG